MFAFLFAPLLVVAAFDNGAFLEKAVEGRWEFVGYQERTAGPRDDGSIVLPLESHGNTFILFKQRPPEAPGPVTASR